LVQSDLSRSRSDRPPKSPRHPFIFFPCQRTALRPLLSGRFFRPFELPPSTGEVGRFGRFPSPFFPLMIPLFNRASPPLMILSLSLWNHFGFDYLCRRGCPRIFCNPLPLGVCLFFSSDLSSVLDLVLPHAGHFSAQGLCFWLFVSRPDVSLTYRVFPHVLVANRFDPPPLFRTNPTIFPPVAQYLPILLHGLAFFDAFVMAR